MSLNNLLAQSAATGVQDLYSAEIAQDAIQIQETKVEFEGDVTIVVFPLLRMSKKGPEQTAEDLGSYLLNALKEVTAFNVVKGFLNLSIDSSVYLEAFKEVQTAKNFGFNPKASGKTYMVEYSSPNTNKPLHLGHLRNIFLGHSVSEILKANGHRVLKTQIINDRGIHICKSMLAWQKFGKGETPKSTGVKGDKFVGKYYVAFDKAYKEEIAELISSGIEEEEAKKQAPLLVEAQEILLKWEAKDPEVYSLWEEMNGWVYEGFETTYKTMGVTFDKLYYESDTYIKGKEHTEAGLEKGIFYQKEDGSVWANLQDTKLDDKLLLRGDGTSVYMTQDIGTAIERHIDYPDLSGIIYTVGNEQDHHFKVLFTILEKLKFEWAKECSHLSYGMVELPKGMGRMKSREGTVVDADDLMQDMIDVAEEMTKERGHIEGMSDDEKQELYDTIGLGALKYFLLKVDPKKKLVFNPNESIDLNGNTGPFIQYAYARIQSILNKAEIEGAVNSTVELSEIEKTLTKQILKFPSVIEESGKLMSPAILSNYIFDTVKLYNSFYQTMNILKEENEDLKALRIALSKTTAHVIETGMKLLGVRVPSKM